MKEMEKDNHQSSIEIVNLPYSSEEEAKILTEEMTSLDNIMSDVNLDFNSAQ